MIDDVYNKQILALALDIPRIGRLSAPQASATRHSRLCGSRVTVDLVLDGDRLADYAHEVKACALGQCSASVLARSVVGATVAEIRAARDMLHAMLKENGPLPTGRFADLALLEPVRDYKARHTSVLLPWDATLEAIDAIAAQRAAE
ncbi:MAG: iron-sulfur cluster assembly scaffold protein [Phyllobacteriaceae bacterium]|nr:iron-sulfur cluster assembly scaffold protein [Phyllobacteriaceae bacterium]